MIATSVHAQPLETVASVDLNKYMGKWYEIASFPQRFQKNCYATTADYSFHEKGYVIVINQCNKGSVTGKVITIKGKAFVDPGSNNAKLKVQFFGFLKGKYWIIDLPADYSYAVVSHPNKKHLWILSRKSKMNEVEYQDIVARLKLKGLNTERLVRTPQL
jgi:apolipoprotein D and lipocalin family protein